MTQAAFEGAEINMPAGTTMWRFKNALSWVANLEGITEEQRLDIQAVAGKVR